MSLILFSAILHIIYYDIFYEFTCHLDICACILGAAAAAKMLLHLLHRFPHPLLLLVNLIEAQMIRMKTKQTKINSSSISNFHCCLILRCMLLWLFLIDYFTITFCFILFHLLLLLLLANHYFLYFNPKCLK